MVVIFSALLYSYTLLKMDMSGLLHQITSNWVNNTNKDIGSDEFRSLGYQDTLFPFLIISGGFMIVIVLTLIETIMKRPEEHIETVSKRVAWADDYSNCNEFKFSCTIKFLIHSHFLSGNSSPQAKKLPQLTK